MARRVSARAARVERERRARAALYGTIADRLAIATDPAASGEELATVPPLMYEPDPDPDLVLAVLAHARVPAGVVGRYATARDRRIRLAVVTHPLCMPATLRVMAADSDPEISKLASARLAQEA